MFHKKNVLKNFEIFTGKYICWSFLLITFNNLLTVFRPVTLLTRDTKLYLQNRCFPMNVSKFLRTPVLKNICQWQVFEFPGPRPFAWAPALALAPYLYLQVLVPDLYLPALAPNFVFTGPGPQFAFNSPSLKFVFTGPGPKFVFTGTGL